MTTHATAVLDVAVLGQTFCDLVFQGAPLTFAPGTETYASGLSVSPGGAATRAVASARLGATTALVTELADDELGRVVRAHLDREPGLSLAWISTCPSTPVSVALTSSTDRAFLTYDQGRRAPSIVVDTLPPTRYVHAGLVEGVPDVVRAARGTGTVVVAGVGWDASGTWTRDHLDALVDVDVFCLNTAEAMAYTRALTVPDAVAALSALVALVVVTDGAHGAIVAGPGRRTVRVPGYPVRTVDPTGAGDVFVAALMVGLAAGDDAVDAARFGNAAAALAVAAPGGAAAAPSRSRVLDVVATGSPAPTEEV